MNPFLPFEPKQLMERMLELDEFKEYNFTKKELHQVSLFPILPSISYTFRF